MKKKYKIAVNTRFLISNKLEGIGTYSHQVLKRLIHLLPEVEFHFLFDRDYSQEYIYSDNVIPHVIGPQARHPILWYWWFEKSVTQWLKNNSMDLFLSPDSFMSLKSDTKTFLVMHDLAFEHYPEHVPFLVRKYYQHFFPKFAKKAEHIFAVSNFTKQDIVKQYQVNKEKISIAYCGVSEVYKPVSIERKIEIRTNISSGDPYFICIGSLNPRKNIQKVIQAYNLLKKENKVFENHKLVIVGAKGWKTNSLFQEINDSNFKQDIILLGHLEPQELAKYLAASVSLVFPSLFEGFGIPIVEAFKCEVPVITSKVSSTKEIGEGASWLVDPLKIVSITNAMAIMTPEYSQESYMSNNITKKLKEYNWDKTAEVFKQEILKLLNK